MSIVIPNDGLPVAEVTLSGAHVRLEPLRESHFEALLAAAQHETETFPFTFVPRARDALRGWLDEALDQAGRGIALPFATIDLRDEQLVGSTRFGNLEFWKWPAGPIRAARNPDAVEIGWTWLAPRAQRSAINSEAKLLMLTHAFESWKVSRVTLKTDARNARSRAAIARIGGKFDGVLRAHMPASDGGLRDTAFFSLLDAEWPENKARLAEKLARGTNR
jgi:RimJ/RimL family protein N-acetyltransferase